MVLTITTNPMLDKTIYLPDFSVGKIFRSEKVEDVPGGKGINISLQLSKFGIDNIAIGFLGGEIGSQIKRLLDKDNIINDFVWVKGNTRIGFTVLNESNLEQTSVFEPNHRVSEKEKNDLIEKAVKYSTKCSIVAISGSVPDKAISNIYKEIIQNIKSINSSLKVFFDSYGDEFKQGLISKPYFVKQNKKEAETFLNKKLNTEKDFISALDSYNGIPFVIITNGADNSYLKFENVYYRVIPPSVKVINPIGSGDTLTAGLIYGFLKNYDFVETLKFGFASAAANASKWEIAKNSIEEVKKYINSVIVNKI